MEIELTEDLLLPTECKGFFKVEKLKKDKKGYRLIVKENKNQIPKDLEGKEVVLNGYCDMLELIDHTLKGELMYVEIYRRRWKEAGHTESFSNTYDLHHRGCKLTKGFGNFLKELTRKERSELFSSVKGLQSVWEENKLLV